MTIRLLAFAASLRRDSLNRKLLALAAEAARRAGAEVDLAEFREFDMPMYDADLESGSGMPATSIWSASLTPPTLRPSAVVETQHKNMTGNTWFKLFMGTPKLGTALISAHSGGRHWRAHSSYSSPANSAQRTWPKIPHCLQQLRDKRLK